MKSGTHGVQSDTAVRFVFLRAKQIQGSSARDCRFRDTWKVDVGTIGSVSGLEVEVLFIVVPVRIPIGHVSLGVLVGGRCDVLALVGDCEA